MKSLKARYKQIACLSILLIMPICSIIMVLVTIKIWQLGGNFTSFPSENIVLTAEYLYENPVLIPKDIFFTINDKEGGICVYVPYSSDIGLEPFWDRWFLNGSRIPYDAYTFSYWTQDVSFCIKPSYVRRLMHGLHLVELEFYSSPFSKDLAYQWAIKIEPTGIPTPSATPSAP